jgi:molybdenum cofactor guanylyltransferase
VTGFVLAGGKSIRMGEDKAFIKLENRTLLERALDLARKVCPEVRIVGEGQKFSAYAATVEDIFPKQGPLAGIHAALKNSSTELNLMLAVDMPFMDPGFLNYLATEARTASALITVPLCAGRWQPLCAVYRRDFATVAEKSLIQNHNKIDPLFAQVATRVIEETELLQRGFTPEIFRNLNTPQEFNQAQTKIR